MGGTASGLRRVAAAVLVVVANDPSSTMTWSTRSASRGDAGAHRGLLDRPGRLRPRSWISSLCPFTQLPRRRSGARPLRVAATLAAAAPRLASAGACWSTCGSVRTATRPSAAGQPRPVEPTSSLALVDSGRVGTVSGATLDMVDPRRTASSAHPPVRCTRCRGGALQHQVLIASHRTRDGKDPPHEGDHGRRRGPGLRERPAVGGAGARVPRAPRAPCRRADPRHHARGDERAAGRDGGHRADRAGGQHRGRGGGRPAPRGGGPHRPPAAVDDRDTPAPQVRRPARRPDRDIIPDRRAPGTSRSGCSPRMA